MLISDVNSHSRGLSSTRESRNQGIDSLICAALPSGPVSRTQSSFTRPMCPSEKPAEDLDPHRLQGIWIMHGANAASLRPPTSTTCQHRQQEEQSTEEERHTGKTYGGCRGEEVEGRGVGSGAVRGWEKGKGYRKENWSRQRKERKDRILQGGRKGGEFERGWRGQRQRNRRVKAAGGEKKEQKYLQWSKKSVAKERWVKKSWSTQHFSTNWERTKPGSRHWCMVK